MEKIQSQNSTEQRRKLLKGALAASSVAGMGYSGTALASVTQCIASQTTTVYPQFVFGETPPQGSAQWAWKKVAVYKFKVGNDDVEGYALKSGTFRVTDGSVIRNPKLSKDQTGYPKNGFVVVYFDSTTKSEAGAYPEFKTPGNGVAQASLNCLSSLNPNLTGTNSPYKFGG